jgi:hypothetical protein
MSDTWQQKRAEFQARFDTINTTNESIDSLVSSLKNNIAAYIQTGGLHINPDTNPAHGEIMKQIQSIKAVKKQYNELQQDITNYIATHTQYHDLDHTLKESGALKQQLQRLEKINKKLDIDVESALARDELLRSKDTGRNAHMLFLLNRPIKKQMIPVLWVMSIIFIGIALIMVKMNMPVDIIAMPSAEFIVGSITGFVSQPIVLVSLLGAAMIVILFLSLKVARVI